MFFLIFGQGQGWVERKPVKLVKVPVALRKVGRRTQDIISIASVDISIASASLHVIVYVTVILLT